MSDRLMSEECRQRREGGAGRHAQKAAGVKVNWIKIYDKAGSVLRVEMVIKKPRHSRCANTSAAVAAC